MGLIVWIYREMSYGLSSVSVMMSIRVVLVEVLIVVLFCIISGIVDMESLVVVKMMLVMMWGRLIGFGFVDDFCSVLMGLR